MVQVLLDGEAPLAFLLHAHKKRLTENCFFLPFLPVCRPLTLFPSLGPLALSSLPSPIFELLSKALSVN